LVTIPQWVYKTTAFSSLKSALFTATRFGACQFKR